MVKNVRIRVIDVVHKATSDFDEMKGVDTNKLDALTNRCALAVKTALEIAPKGISEIQQSCLIDIFESLRYTHQTIRLLLRQGADSPIAADSLPMSRLQVEMLYSLCLMVEDFSNIDWYMKHSWKQSYRRHLLQEREVEDLPRFKNWIGGEARGLFEKLRSIAGVSDAEVATIESEELGTPLPPGVIATPIRMFPAPSRAIDHVKDPRRKQMLMRFYPEYQALSSHVHGSSSQMRILKTLLNPRSPYRRFFTSSDIEKMFQRMAEDAIWISFLSIVQAASEMVALYPADTHLRATLAEGWQPLTESHLLARAIWEMRTRSLLGVLSG